MKWWFFEQYIYAVNIADRNTIDMINKDKLRTEHQVISAFILLTTTWRHHAYSLFSLFSFLFFVCTTREPAALIRTLYKTVKDRDLQWAVDQHLKQQKQRLSFDRHFFFRKYPTWLSPYTLNIFLLFISKFWTITFLH